MGGLERTVAKPDKLSLKWVYNADRRRASTNILTEEKNGMRELPRR